MHGKIRCTLTMRKCDSGNNAVQERKKSSGVFRVEIINANHLIEISRFRRDAGMKFTKQNDK